MNFFLLRETLGMAARALIANRLRSVLALLGIVIGVATLIGMVALINGFQRSFQKSIQSFGNNTIYIRRIRPGMMFGGDVPDSLKQRRAFTMDDARAILTQCPSVRAIAPFKWPFADLKLAYRGRSTRGTFCYGTNEDYLTTHGYDLARGRFFTEEEVRRNADVAVIGRDTRETLFRDASGIGERIHVNGIPFTVIGEFEPKGRMLGNNFDEVIAIPYTTIDKHFPVSQDAPIWFPKRGELFLDAIATSPEESERAQQQIIEVLRIRRHLPSNKANDFAVLTDETFINLYKSITGGITIVMTLVSFIALVVGGIGIMNIMLVAVTERTREIGVRKALGAQRRAILTQFLLEAIMLTAVGGIVGVMLGGGISWLVHAVSPLPTYVSMVSVILGLGFSAAVGLFFGLYPAMRASKLDAVDALRYE
jgi:putative ABC transport system permease protein